ncbi:hypothetical protein A5654_10040 [Mycolicibacterium fortuitum]|nr:hypothetical protein A5668_09795 [Mycolicibacterium fortuitum]OBK71484.1 hypothetical protein A5654_10040 [Mycolicibacterium fortuitum]
MPHWGSSHTSGPRAVELRVPARAEALAVVRAMTRCLAHYEGLDHDTAADLALAIDEACTVLIDMAPAEATLVLVEDPRADEFVVRISTDCEVVDNDPDAVVLSAFTRRVLEALTDRVGTFVDDTGFGQQGETRPALGISLTVRRRWAATPG